MGSVGANQQVWIQIIVRAHKDDQPKDGHLIKTHDKWKDDTLKEINKILVRDEKTKVSGHDEGEDGAGQRITVSPGEQDVVKALERSISKLGYDTGIRAMYIARKDSFVGSERARHHRLLQAVQYRALERLQAGGRRMES